MVSDPTPAATAPLLEQAAHLVGEVSRRGALVRVCGSVGIRLLEGPGARLLDRAGRLYKDIDLVTRRRDRSAVREMFTRLEAVEDPQVHIASEGRRFAYTMPLDGTTVDVFVDELDFCHRLDLRDRLEQTDLVLAPADLLLQKAQIVKLTGRDQLDLLALLLTCPVADEGERTISLARLRAVLAADWGFHHTVEGNLLRLDRRIPEIPELIPEERRQATHAIRRIVDFLSSTPKTLRYRLRALIGTRMSWYVEVSDDARIF